MRKKLLFVTAALGYGIGGSEKALIEMLKCLDLSKYDITVLSLNEKPEKPFYKDGIKVIYGCKDFLHMSMPLRDVIKKPFKYSLKQLWVKFKIAFDSRMKSIGLSCEKIWELISDFISPEKTYYDIVIGYGPGLATFYAIDKVKSGHKILWVDTDLEKAHFDLEYLRKFYDKADRVVVVDKSGVQRFSSIYPSFSNKVLTIRNIIPIIEIHRKADEDIGFNDSYNGTRILSVGRLCEAKAFHLAVGAAAVLRDKGYSFRWYIVGWGALESELRRLIKQNSLDDNFILLGQKNNPYPFFKQTDIYVQTSIYEGSPLTIEEAIAFGKPVISTNIPAISEIITDGVNGLISEMNSESIADKIMYLLNNENLFKSISNNLSILPISYTQPIKDFDKMINSF